MAAITPDSLEASSVKQIYAFPDATFIENIHLRTTGDLLLTTLTSGNLLTLDPTASSPTPTIVIGLPGSTGLTGIATVAPNLYAISGGKHSIFLFENNSMFLYVVSIPSSGPAKILDQIPVSDTVMMNGMVSLPGAPHILLSGDSVGGRIIRINTKTRLVDIAFSDPTLGVGTGPGGKSVPLGVNGLHTFGKYLYFSNSAQGTFSRVEIDGEGGEIGDIEVVARLEGEIGMGNAYDDFCIDGEGNAYVTLHDSSVRKITAERVQTNFVGGGEGVKFLDPTAAVMDADGQGIWVCTGGSVVDGLKIGGQVVWVRI